jgi:GTPase SAR1 family protein
LVVPLTGAGKTALHTQFIHQSFSSHIEHTTGVDFGVKVIELGGRRLKLRGLPPGLLSLSPPFL